MVVRGIQLVGQSPESIETDKQRFLEKLDQLDLAQFVLLPATSRGIACAEFRLRDDIAHVWAPDSDTTQICQRLHLEPLDNSIDLEREILVAMLLAPFPFIFPSYDELAAAVRIRLNIVAAARKTLLDFNTSNAERPDDLWTYHEDTGFTVIPGKSVITALQRATQPQASGKLYSFSCYRATEYVILLALAQEISSSNPSLFNRLQTQWETRAIKSGEFHDVFLHEYGSMECPLPIKFYVPGDRIWFRNPDNRSSDVTGYEGSWVFYLGNGLFSNFWKQGEPYTLTEKCLEIYHWRNATYLDEEGELQLNERIVENCVRSSLDDPEQTGRILDEMLRLRAPKGSDNPGGCIDASRECVGFVCESTSSILSGLSI